MKLQEFSQRPVPVSIQVLQYHAGIYHVPLTGRQFPVFPKTAPPVIFRFQSQLLFYRDHMDPAAAFDEFFVIHQFPGLVFPYKLHFLAFMMRAVMGGEILHHGICRFGKLSLRIAQHQKMAFLVGNAKSKNIQLLFLFLLLYQIQEFFLIPLILSILLLLFVLSR